MQTKQISPKWRISLLSILALPACFALGWYLREWKFERDVQTAAEKLIKQVNGEIIPDLGIVTGGRDAIDRYDELQAEQPEDKFRRKSFFDRLIENGTLQETKHGTFRLKCESELPLEKKAINCPIKPIQYEFFVNPYKKYFDK